MSMYAHGLVEDRTLRITPFHWACWILGVVGIATGFTLLHVWQVIFLAIPAAVIGWPVKDGPTLHEWIYRKWRARSQRNKSDGVRRHAPLRREPNSESLSKLDKSRTAVASVRNRDGSIIPLPMLTDPEQNYLTLVLHISGWGRAWSEGGPASKADYELQLLVSLAKAVATTKNPDVSIVQGRMFRTDDKEQMFLYNLRRLSEDMREAGKNPDDSVEATLIANVYEAQDTVGAYGGDGIHYLCLRMPWPRVALRRKLKLDDPIKFGKSDIYTTIGRIIEAYRSNDIQANFLTEDELRYFYQLQINLSQLPTLRFYRQRDRELREVLGETETGEDLPFPLAVRSDTDGSGYIECDGTFIAAGYATKLNRPDLPGGFQDQIIDLPDDVYYTFSTWTSLPKTTGITGEKRKLQGREVLSKALADNPITPYLSTPELDDRVNSIVELRARMARSGGRASEFLPMFFVVASSVEDLEHSWTTVTQKLADLYDIQRSMHPDDIEDIVLASMGQKID